jgi:hypothetical protein
MLFKKNVYMVSCSLGFPLFCYHWLFFQTTQWHCDTADVDKVYKWLTGLDLGMQHHVNLRIHAFREPFISIK